MRNTKFTVVIHASSIRGPAVLLSTVLAVTTAHSLAHAQPTLPVAPPPAVPAAPKSTPDAALSACIKVLDGQTECARKGQSWQQFNDL
jgi:hypothetical protein